MLPRARPRAFALTITVLAACRDDGADAEPCSGKGHLHGDHCHCDPGYIPSEDGTDCLSDPGDADTAPADTGAGDDTGADDRPYTPLDFHAGSITATLRERSDGSRWWSMLARDGQTWLTLDNDTRNGGLDAAGGYTLGPDEASAATCGLCITLQTGCEPHGDHAHCAATFMPVPGGEVRFDSLGTGVGETWSGALSGLRLVEVRVNPNTGQTREVPDGDAFIIEAWSFDATLEDAP